MEVTHTPKKDTGSYRSILKSSSLIGGASVLNILIGMVRTKFVAVLLGPSGVGLIGMYGQITGLVGSVTSMGIASSGVRQVAEAVGHNDEDRIARTVKTLRRTVWLTGSLGLLVMTAFCIPLSRITFGSSDQAWPIALLGVTLLTGAVAAGQGCIINGTRRIADLAKISIIGGINGTIISIPCFYLWRESGIIPSLILSAFAALATSWWFARRVSVKPIVMPWSETYGEARQLLVLGVSFMGAGMVTALSNYLIRIVMLRQLGIMEVGIYQAAFNLSGMLVGFVLSAMGSDYYPRLTANASDNVSLHRMVNEQSQISVLLSLPALAAMMIFAPLIIKIFYAATFASAVPILRWCILGILGRVFSWPIGFLMLAKGNGKTFFTTEVFSAAFHLAAVYILISYFGLQGSGIAFMLVYIVYTGLMLYVMRRLVGTTWDKYTFRLVVSSILITSSLMVNSIFTSNIIISWIINITLLLSVIWCCLQQLLHQSQVDIKSLLAKLKLEKTTGAN